MKLGILSWVVGLVGFALVVLGVALVHVPSACIVAGGVMVAYARLMDRAAAAIAAAPPGRED